MQPYGAGHPNTGVTGYESGDDFIRVRFHDGGIYRYTYDSTGAEQVERMKQLAVQGSGLSTFINQSVRLMYAEQEPIASALAVFDGLPVSYEVHALVQPGLRDAYERYLRERHIPDLLATGAFTEASLLRAEPGNYRVRYLARDRAALHRYFTDHAPRLRADFIETFPEGVELAREEWTVIERTVVDPTRVDATVNVPPLPPAPPSGR